MPCPAREFRLGDWGDGLDERFDLILCNPPYVEDGAALPPDVARWEPAAALYAGPDGLDAYRALAPQLARLLAPKRRGLRRDRRGTVIAATALFAAQGFTIESRRDLRGIERCLVLTIDRE